MEKHLCDNYVSILREELVPSFGCTDPVALAYTAAVARENLCSLPTSALVRCSGNMIKNAKSVTVPGTGGLAGIEAAVCVGVTGGDAGRELEVLSKLTKEDVERAKELIAEGFCRCELATGVNNLYVDITVFDGRGSARAVLENSYTNIVLIEKDGETVFRAEPAQEAGSDGDRSLMNLDDILNFARQADLSQLTETLERQIDCNTAIANEGMRTLYGAGVSRSVAKESGVYAQAKARAAAAAEARMTGCPLPVIINSGSGNQGITVSVPVITVAEARGVEREKLYRALILSNLVSIYIKSFIGSLSAFCGAVSASCGAGAGIAYIEDASPEVIKNTVINTLAGAGGIFCDGAKASCAAKIACSLEAALFSYDMASQGRRFHTGDGLVGETADDTIRRVAHVGKVGMASTDVEILNVMLGNVEC